MNINDSPPSWPETDVHGNGGLNAMGNWDYSQGSVEDYKKMKADTNTKLAGGYYITKEVYGEDGITTVERGTGAVERYVTPTGSESAPSARSHRRDEERKFTSFENRRNEGIDVQPYRSTGTKVRTTIGQAVAAEFVEMLRHRMGIGQAFASEFAEMHASARRLHRSTGTKDRTGFGQAFAAEFAEMLRRDRQDDQNNLALEAEAKNLIQAMSNSPYACDQTRLELETLVKSFERCEDMHQRIALLEQIQAKVEKIKNGFDPVTGTLR